ncbi:MAG: hypothetical protein AAGA48_22325 [Myxococcota bacterium]
MGFVRNLLLAVVSLGAASSALAQVPDRQIPPTVLTELRLLANRFDLALAADCDETRCFSKGCTYIAHSVADQPKSTSLPGLGGEPGPGSVDAQEYLTSARCAFAYEENVSAEDAKALARRLRAKLSSGWTSVSVTTQRLEPLPDYLQKPPPPEPDPEEQALEEEPLEEELPAEEAWSFVTAGRELWTSLLPHFYWMIGLVLATMAGAILIWAWRRVGQASLEEQMLLAEMGRGESGPSEAMVSETSDEETFVAEQEAAWTERMEGLDPAKPDPEIQALLRELLRSRDLPLLAKAVLRFPQLSPLMPAGGGFATAKLELADFLKTVDDETLPSDAEFYRNLNRNALSAAVASQSDAQIVVNLREEFGPSGLATLMAQLEDRPAALLFALAPTDAQHEIVRLLPTQRVATMAEMLMRSNRMSPSETEHLFEVLAAARGEVTIPGASKSKAITDLGEEFDAAGALSVLLESVNPARRTTLFRSALERSHGSFPAWYRGILVADMLFELPVETRADLLLELDIEPLAAWMSLLDGEAQSRLLAGMPRALVSSVQSVSELGSRSRQVALADRGRRDLARAFQRQLQRAQIPFERVVVPAGGGGP